MAPTRHTVEAAEREQLILRRRRDRVSYAAIGQELGVSPARVHQIYKRALSRGVVMEAAELRHEESELLDRAVASLMKLAETASKDSDRIAAWGQVTRLMERRARLFGLDAAEKVEVSGGVKYEVVGLPDEEL